MSKYLNSFWNAGFWSFFLVGLIAFALKIGRLELDGFFLTIAGIGIWILLMVLTRFLLIQSDMQYARIEFASIPPPDQHSNPASESRREAIAASLAVGLRRTGQWSDWKNCTDQDDLLSRLFEQSETAIQLWYMPVQALVWALPALGFIGTAWKMRGLLAFLLDMMAHQRSLDIGALVTAAPYLNEALGIISLALTLSAVTYLAVSLLLKRDLDWSFGCVTHYS
jgi:hypothetical protein